MAKERVDHPDHYTCGGVEAIDVIEAWKLGFCLGNTVKYISRAGRKDYNKELEDLQKASWYLQRKIDRLAAKKQSYKDRAAKAKATRAKKKTTKKKISK